MATRFEEVLSEALKLSPRERIAMIEQLAASFTVREGLEQLSGSEQPLSEAELSELMRIDPLPPADVAAQGLLGTWVDQGISDGAEWVNEQKRQRRDRRKW